MDYKPLSDARHQPLGSGVKASPRADDDVADLPGGVYFSGELADGPQGDIGLYYKDATGHIRRVYFSTPKSRFEFAPVDEEAHFSAISEILVVPEVDPRAWAAAREAVSKPLPELATLKPGSFFTAISATERSSSQRIGVYRLGRDGMIRRMLKEPPKGLKWSDAIPPDRFGNFGDHLAVTRD